MDEQKQQIQELQQQKLLEIIPVQDDSEEREKRKKNFKRIAHRHFHTLQDVEKQRLLTYETLDYEIIENELQREANLKESPRHKKVVNLVMWITFVIIGASTGTMAFCMNSLVSSISYFRWDSARFYIDKGEKGYGLLIFIGLAICYSLVSAVLVNYISLAAGGSGIPEVKAYLNGCNQPGLLTFKTIIVKIIGVCFSVGAGLICGKEGPLVHTGSIFAALYSHLPKVGDFLGLKQFRNDHDKRDFVSGGAAAGVAAAFGAPIGGILFSLEEASSFWSTPLTWKVFLCACMSTFCLNICKGAFIYGSANLMNYPKTVIYGLTRQNGNEQTQSAFTLWQFPFFIILAIVGGLLGATFNQVNKKITDFRFKYYIRIKIVRILEAVTVAAFTAIIFFYAPMLNYKCQDTLPDDFNYDYAFNSPENANSTFVLYDTLFVRYGCPQHQFNDLATLTVNTEEQAIKIFFHSYGPFRVSSLFIYQVISFVAAVLIYGASVPSGLFVPGILMGSAFGRLFGILLNYISAQNPGLYPSFASNTVDEGTWAWLGATAMLAGSSRITISLSVIMIETTGNFLYTLPTIFIVTVAKWVGDLFNISLYDIHIQKKNLPFVEPMPLEGQDQLMAEDLMSAPVDIFYEIEKIGVIFDTLMSSKHNGYPIVTNVFPEDVDHTFTPEQLENRRYRGKLRGMMLRNNIIVMLKNLKNLGVLEQHENVSERDVINNQVREIKRLQIDIFKTTMQSRVTDVHELEEEIIEIIAKNREKLIDFRPYMNPGPYIVYNSSKLSKIFRLYRSMGLRHLPVINDANEVVGILTRKELMTDFKQDLF